jgi:hypothetical protein
MQQEVDMDGEDGEDNDEQHLNEDESKIKHIDF